MGDPSQPVIIVSGLSVSISSQIVFRRLRMIGIVCGAFYKKIEPSGFENTVAANRRISYAKHPAIENPHCIAYSFVNPFRRSAN